MEFRKREELESYISNIDKISQKEYQEIARLFEKKALDDISKIWDRHKSRLIMELQKVKLCTKGSTVNSSTALGYLIEEFIVKQLPNCYEKIKGSTTNAAADFFWRDKDKIELYVNLKVDKGGKGNNAICAANKLINLYSTNKRPKLMLIFKVIYSINETKSIVNVEGFKTVFLELFLLEYRVKLSKDKRNWSADFKPESGRLQVPRHKSDAPIKDIPHPDEINNFIAIELPKILRAS